MARQSIRQFSFTNGEVSPRLHMRPDMEFYYGGLAKCENWIPDHKGNLIRRPPTRFVGASKDGVKPCLYQLNIGRDCPVVIEAYPDCFRFIVARAPVFDGASRLELPHTYGIDYCDLEFAEDCGAMFLAHENHMPAVLQKTADGFTLEPYETLPFDDLNSNSDCKLCLGGGGGLENIGNGTLRPFVCEPGDGLTLTRDAGVTTINVTATAYNGNGVCEVDFPIGTEAGAYEIWDGVSEIGSVNLSINSAELTSEGCSPFIADMIGQQIRILDEDGVGVNEPNTWVTVTVTGLNSASSVDVTYDGLELVCTDLFQLPAYSDGNFPETVWVFNDRVWFARENALVASKVGDFFDWEPTDPDGTVNDDNAIYYNIAAGECGDVRWLWQQGRQLVVGTSEAVYSLLGAGTNGSFAAGSVAEQLNEAVGVADIRPVQAGSSVFFVDRSGTKLYGTGFGGQYDQIGLQEYTLFSDHIGDCGLKKLVYQEHPYSIIWAVTDDNRLVSMTAVPGQNVKGWAQHVLGGQLVKAGCCVAPEVCEIASVHGPDEKTDDVFLVVKRTIGGADVFHIEVVDRFHDNKTHWFEAGCLDSFLEPDNISDDDRVSIVGNGPTPFTPQGTVSGNYSVYDGREWFQFISDGEVMPVAPNTLSSPVAGRDWWLDGDEWVRLEKARLCDEPEYVPHDAEIYRAPCGVERRADWVDGVTGLEHLAGEAVMVYADGNMFEVDVDADGGADAVGGVVRIGLPYDSTITLLPFRFNLGSTDGANDPTRAAELAVNVMGGVWLEVGSGSIDHYSERLEDFERINFETDGLSHPLPFTGWAEHPMFGDISDNNESGVSIRARGPWPAIIRNTETITMASGGR